jgi:hypothetical protein
VEGSSFAVARAAEIDSTGAIDGATGNLGDCLDVDGTSPCGSGGGTSGSGTFVEAEVPSGPINSSNTSFTLAIRAPATSMELFRNGLLLQQNKDYTIAWQYGYVSEHHGAASERHTASLLSRFGHDQGCEFRGHEDARGRGEREQRVLHAVMSQVPSPASSVAVFRNGMQLTSGLDYTISTTALTFRRGTSRNRGI